MFRRTPSQGDRGRRAAVDFVVCFGFGGISCFFFVFFFERPRPAASMRPPCLIYLSTSIAASPLLVSCCVPLLRSKCITRYNPAQPNPAELNPAVPCGLSIVSCLKEWSHRKSASSAVHIFRTFVRIDFSIEMSTYMTRFRGYD